MSETLLTRKAREAFAAYSGLGRQIIDQLITEVERLNSFEVAVRRLVPPPSAGTTDFTDRYKAMMFDALRHLANGKAQPPE